MRHMMRSAFLLFLMLLGFLAMSAAQTTTEDLANVTYVVNETTLPQNDTAEITDDVANETSTETPTMPLTSPATTEAPTEGNESTAYPDGNETTDEQNVTDATPAEVDNITSEEETNVTEQGNETTTIIDLTTDNETSDEPEETNVTTTVNETMITTDMPTQDETTTTTATTQEQMYQAQAEICLRLAPEVYIVYESNASKLLLFLDTFLEDMRVLVYNIEPVLQWANWTNTSATESLLCVNFTVPTESQTLRYNVAIKLHRLEDPTQAQNALNATMQVYNRSLPTGSLPLWVISVNTEPVILTTVMPTTTWTTTDFTSEPSTTEVEPPFSVSVLMRLVGVQSVFNRMLANITMLKLVLHTDLVNELDTVVVMGIVTRGSLLVGYDLPCTTEAAARGLEARAESLAASPTTWLTAATQMYTSLANETEKAMPEFEIVIESVQASVISQIPSTPEPDGKSSTALIVIVVLILIIFVIVTIVCCWKAGSDKKGEGQRADQYADTDFNMTPMPGTGVGPESAGGYDNFNDIPHPGRDHAV